MTPIQLIIQMKMMTINFIYVIFCICNRNNFNYPFKAILMPFFPKRVLRALWSYIIIKQYRN
jgi:hypothetical protein